MKNYVYKILFYFGFILSIFISEKIINYFIYFVNIVYTGILSYRIHSIGNGTIFKSVNLIGGNYISVGSFCHFGKNLTLTAWSKHNHFTYSPFINIGDNVQIGSNCHISTINSITIGNNVLIGKNVSIIDNSHGFCNEIDLFTPPSKRKLYSKGSIEILDNVWIGDKVTILSNVIIGKNTIIGANSVVTKSIPDNSIVVGVPAKIIKNFNK